MPQIDERIVTALAWRDGYFMLELEGGERIFASRVVLAVGITHFDHVPSGLASTLGAP